MSCPDATAPINIVYNIAGECQLKCDYNPLYDNTTVSAENKGDYILFNFGQTERVATFNTEGYRVNDMRLYQPSLHRYSGKTCSAELLISHTNVSKNMKLVVCIPVESGERLENDLDALIFQVAERANTEGGNATINLPNFNISRLVPIKPFYSYTGTTTFEPCNEIVQYVVFDITDALIITNKNLNNLKNIISPNNYDAKENPDGFFYNKQGPYRSSDEIYINCQPTDSSGDVMVNKEGNPLSKSDTHSGDYFKKMMNMYGSDAVISIFISIFILIVLIKLWEFLSNTVADEELL